MLRAARFDGGLEIAHGELRVEALEDGVGGLVVRRHLHELQDVRPLVVKPVLLRPSGHGEARRRIDGDAMLAVDRARSKLYRRDVTFTPCPGAHDETRRA